MENVHIAFEQRVHVVALDQILPSKMLTAAVAESAKYKRIAASLKEVGLVEPLVLSRIRGGGFMLLDGHVRLSILKEQGALEARCLVADDDEAFTYNKRVNRLAVIQEHYMIVRAIDRGVSEEKLAAALSVDVHAIHRRRYLLNGINADVAELLKDKSVGIHAFQKLRKMKPIRQLEVAELMISANNYSANYVKVLLAMTKPVDLQKPQEARKPTGLSPEQMERLEREMATANNDYKELEASYGDDLLLLVVAAGFLERILSRPSIEQFFSLGHQDLLEGLKGIVAAVSLGESSAVAA